MNLNQNEYIGIDKITNEIKIKKIQKITLKIFMM